MSSASVMFAQHRRVKERKGAEEKRAAARWVTFQGQRYTLAQLARHVAKECGIAPGQFAPG